MKRLFWLGVGLAAGAYLTRRATEAAQNLTAAGVGANLADGLLSISLKRELPEALKPRTVAITTGVQGSLIEGEKAA